MFRIEIKYLFLLFSFACAIAQEKPETIILYRIENSKTRIIESLPPIYIDFSSASDAERSAKEIEFRFRADEPDDYSQNLSWKIQGSQKERLWYFSTAQVNIEKLGKYGSFKVPFFWTKRVHPFIRQKSIREHIDEIRQVRGSYKHLSNDQRHQDLRIKFKSNLNTATQSTNRTINLDDLPIKIHGPYSGRLMYSLGHQAYIESEYKIVASYITPKWSKDYVFTQSRDSLYNIDLRLYVATPSIIQQDWSIKLSLPVAEDVIWDRESILTQLFSISSIADSISYKWLSPTEIVFRPKKTFRGNNVYFLQSLPIRTNRVSSSVKIDISVSPDGEEYSNFGQSKNGIRIVQPKIVEDTNVKKTFVTLYKGNKVIIIPNIVVDQGPVMIPREIFESVSLVIPDSTDAIWAEPQVNIGTIDYIYDRESKRRLRYEVSRLNYNSGQISLKSAELINHRKSRDQIFFDVDINLTTTSIRLPYPLPITIGQPRASIVEDNIILGSSNDPIIQRLCIYEDPYVKTLGLGDTISYVLEDGGGITFDQEKMLALDSLDYPFDELEISQQPRQYDRVDFIVKKEIEPGDTLKIFKLPLKIYDKKSRIIHSKVEFRSVHGTSYSISDQQHIEIVNVNIDFSKTAEFYPKSQSNMSVYDLPSLTIKNDGSVDILHGKSIKIGLEAISNYLFEKKNLQLESSQPMDRRDIRVIGDQIEIEFPSGLEAHAFIKIGGIGLKISADHELFYRAKLAANFGVEKNNVTSTHTITYGSPSFESPYVQKLVSGAQDVRLYSIACDFGNMPKTFSELEDIIFRLPQELGMSWDPNMDLSLVSDDDQVLAIEGYTQNFEQDIRIHIDKATRERLDIGTKFDINGLRIGAPLPKQLASFHLNVSIDQGRTFAILVNPGKELISVLNRAAIDQQKVREDYYPFTVGRDIIVRLKEPSSFKWDVNNKTVKYSKRDILTSKNGMFKPDYEQNSSRTALKAAIQYDIDHQPSGTKYRPMDYGVNVTLADILIERTITTPQKPNLSVTLNTLYGPIDYENSKGMYQVEFLREDSLINITIGLNTYPPNDMLKNEFLINWYRYPDRYLKNLHLDLTDTLASEREEIVEHLNDLRKELNYYYSTVGGDAYYDWVYWFYTAWYKQRMQKIRGAGFSNFNLSDIQLNSSSIIYDIQKATQHGYNVDIMGASFPSPLDTTNKNRQQELAFQQAWQLYSNGEYIRAEDLLYENFDESGMENYLLVSYYTLFGQIARGLNDQSEFYNKALDRMESFECRMYALARKKLDTKHTRSRLLVWDKNLYSYIQNIDCSERDDDSYPLAISTSNKKFQPWQLAGTDPMSLSVMWLPNQMVSRYDLQYIVSHYPVVPREGKTIISYESIQKELIPFNQEIEFYGGNTYTIEFNDTRHPWKRSLEVSGATAILIYWGLR
jgi:hypothetical protein